MLSLDMCAEGIKNISKRSAEDIPIFVKKLRCFSAARDVSLILLLISFSNNIPRTSACFNFIDYFAFFLLKNITLSTFQFFGRKDNLGI